MRPMTFAAAGLMFASPLVAQTTPAPAVAADKVRCKSHVETGSLAKMVRECHTAAEWQRMSEEGRRNANDFQQVMNSSRGGS